MKNWWNWFLAFALLSLLFIAIPLTYPRTKNKEELRPMFDSYIEKFNKSYKNNPVEYETRLEHFCVSKCLKETEIYKEHRFISLITYKLLQ